MVINIGPSGILSVNISPFSLGLSFRKEVGAFTDWSAIVSEITGIHW